VKLSGLGSETKVGASYYMTYHTVLQKDADYINALNFSLGLAKDMERTIQHNCTQCHDIEVFPYRYVRLFFCLPVCLSVCISTVMLSTRPVTVTCVLYIG